jgi:hypothetical protein
MAAGQVAASLAACRHGIATARTELGDVASARVLQAALEVYEHEVLRLQRAQRAVLLVEEALRTDVTRPTGAM